MGPPFSQTRRMLSVACRSSTNKGGDEMAGQFDTGKITKSRPLYEQVYQRLRKVIIEGGISSGASLTESSLSKQLGVSRTPVREALRQLQQEGLVVLDDKGRFRV